MSDEPQPPDAPSSAGPEARAPLLSALVAMLLAGLFIPGGPPGAQEFCLDDAWIHLSYARSVRLGEGLSYNPGDWETGFSSPLWVLALSVWPLGQDPVLPVKLLGLLLHGLTAWLAAAVALELGRARASIQHPVPLLSIGLLAGVLVACTPVLLQGATSGMEVSLAAALLLAAMLASLRESDLAALALGALATLARPEALFTLGSFAALLALGHRRPRDLAAGLGAALGLGLWIAYCSIVSGYPWPNTQYVKGQGGGLEGLAYLSEQVLPWQPWLVSLTGVVLVGLAIWHDVRPTAADPDATSAAPPVRLELVALLGAWLATALAIALTRPLHEGVLFFEARYFAPIAPLPAIVLALALARPRGWWMVALLLPVAVVTGLQANAVRGQMKAQERSVWRLHGLPARVLAAEVSERSVVAVEGAGAHRWFTPRSVEIVDIIGLNEATIAHAGDDNARACLLVQAGLTHAVLPEQIAAPLSRVLLLRPLRSFEDPAFAQVEERHEVRVLLFAVDGATPSWRERCTQSH